MHKLNLLILLAGLIGGLSAVCPTIFGCRNCSDPTVCTDCETALKYFLQNGTCVRSTVASCRQIDTSGNCLNCFPDHVLAGPQTCSPVASISNCLTYNTTSLTPLCLHCQVGYRLQDNACVLEAFNCFIMSTDGQSCRLCAFGYTLVNHVCVPASGTPDPNCAVIDLYGTCHRCLPLFFLDAAANICRPRTVVNCETYLTDTNTCLSCSHGFYLDGSGACQPQEVDHCAVYVPNQNLCAACTTGFTLNPAGVCVPSGPSLDNCQTIAETGLTCLVCNSGYYLDLSGGCTPQDVLHCVIAVQNENKCATCQPGYYPVEGICVAQNIPNCLSYVSNQNVCFACQDNFVLSGDGLTCTAVLPTIPNCQDYTDATQVACATCVNGFYLINNACLPQAVDNCAVYVVNQNACLTCNSGFQVSQGLCTPVQPEPIPHCLTYSDSSNAVCTVCEAGYYVALGLCEVQSVPNCSQYASNQNACFICSPGFYLAEGECVGQNLPNCLTYVPNVNQCSGCLPNFTLTNGACVPVELPTIPNCQAYTDATQVSCATCALGFYLINNTCQSQAIPNCATYTANLNQCETCQENFALISNACVEIQPGSVPNCLAYSDATNTVCTACVEGYLLVDNTCQLQIVVPPNCAVASQVVYNTCVTCNPGFFLSGRFCSPVSVDHCVSYTENTNTCVLCDNAYQLEGNVCVLIPVPPIPNCAAYTDAFNATCAQCVAGFHLEDNACVADPVVIPNCAAYQDASETTCAVCDLGYFLSGNQCLPQSVPNCVTYVVNVNLCSSCESGYQLVDGVCQLIVITIPNCAVYQDATQAACVTCAAGFYLAANQCLPQSLPNCLTYVANANFCSACASGYQLVGGECQLIVVVIPNCAVYQDATQATCLTCAAGFYLINNSCQVQSIVQCVSYVANANACAQCALGFHVEQDLCVADLPATIPNCSLYFDATNAACATCDLGFYLINNTCQPQSIPNCATYAPNLNFCTSCNVGYQSQGSSCQPIPVIGILNCAAYSDETLTECIACFDGFYLAANTCPPQSVSRCLVYQPNTNICITCAAGYHIDQGLCLSDTQSPVANCNSYTDNVNFVCAVCDIGYYLVANTCQPQAIPNCATYAANNNICTSCSAGFTLQNNVCVSDSGNPVENCEVYSDASLSACLICELSYYLAGNACIPQDVPNCITYVVNLNACTFCEIGYQLANGLCVLVPPVSLPNCAAYADASNSTCTLCVAGYYLAANACLPQNLVNCAVYVANQNVCQTCQPHFFLDTDGVCQAVVGCVEFASETSNVCVRCGAGTFLYNGQCIDQANPNCLTFIADSTLCQQCAPGYYLDITAFCRQQSIVGCVTYIDQTNQCLVCDQGYTRTSANTCNAPGPIPNCATLGSPSSFCITCSSGFYLSADQTECTTQYIPNCATYQPNVNACALCGTGYVVSAAGACVPENSGIQHCIVQNGASCFNCDVNYWPTANLSTCEATSPFKILLPDVGGNYNYMIVVQGALDYSSNYARGDTSDWTFASQGGRLFRISSADGQFDLIAQDGALALEASSTASNLGVWEITFNADGNFLVRNVASNLFVVTPDRLGSFPAEAYFYASSSF